MSSFRLRLTPAQHVWVDQIACERALSRAEVIRGLLRAEFERLSPAERARLEAAGAALAVVLAEDVRPPGRGSERTVAPGVLLAQARPTTAPVTARRSTNGAAGPGRAHRPAIHIRSRRAAS